MPLKKADMVGVLLTNFQPQLDSVVASAWTEAAFSPWLRFKIQIFQNTYAYIC